MAETRLSALRSRQRPRRGTRHSILRNTRRSLGRGAWGSTRQPPSFKAHLASLCREYWAVVLVLIAFVTLGGLYSIVTPLFETPNEPWHYLNIERVAVGATGRSPLPPALVALKDTWGEAGAQQPPLYYALGALLTHWVDFGADDHAVVFAPNPYAALGMLDSSSNKNAVLHMGGEGLFYSGVSLRVHLLRWFSVLCATAVVFLTYCFAREIVPQRRAVAVGTAALVAFNPQFLFINAGVTNESLALVFLTLSLYLASRVVNGKVGPYRAAVALGISTGLAALTQRVGLASIILIPCAYLMHARRRHARDIGADEVAVLRDLVRPALVAVSIALAISGWWYVLNVTSFQDALGLGGLLEDFGGAEVVIDPLHTLHLLFLSYWGLFGWMNIPADQVFYTLALILSVLGVMGLALHSVRDYWRRGLLPHRRGGTVLLLVLWTAIVIASLIWSSQTAGRLEGRALFPVIPILSLLLFVGLTAWTAPRHSWVLALILSILLLVASVIAPFRYIAPAYARPERVHLEEVPPGIQDVDVAFGDKLFLLGYSLGQSSVTVGNTLQIRLYWLGLRRMSDDYTVSVRLYGRQEQQIGALDTYPGGGNYATRLWLPGEVVCDDYAIPVAQDARAPAAIIVRLGVYVGPEREYLPALDARGQEIGHTIEIARSRIAPLESISYLPQQDLCTPACAVNLGDKMMFIGHGLYPQNPSAGDTWEIDLYWQALRQISRDYTVFLHLVDQNDAIVAQIDEQPLAGDYPTHLWEIDEQVRDSHRLPLPEDLPAGEYRLRVGLYWLKTGERLPVVGSDASLTFVTLGPIQVGSGSDQ